MNNVKKYKSILLLGDSHCLIPDTGNIRHCNPGPETWWRIQDLEYFKYYIGDLIKREFFHIIPTDLIVWSLGEIDIRCHFDKQVNFYKRNEDKIIDELIHNGVKTLQAIHPTFGFLGITPPVKKEEIVHLDRQYPITGTNEDRVRWTKKFNTSLKNYCSIYNRPFIDVYEQHSTVDGFLVKELSDGSVHIKNKVKIMEQLELLLDRQ